MIEVEDLLAQHEIFEQRRAALPCAQRVLIVRDAVTVIVREVRGSIGMVAVGGDVLMKLARITGIFGKGRRPFALLVIAKRIVGSR